MLGLCWLLKLLWNRVFILLVGDNIDQVAPSYNYSGNVSIRELWHILTNGLIMLSIHLFDIADKFCRRLRRSRVDPEWSSVLVAPWSSFEPFESLYQKRGPGLMHRQAHADIIALFEVRFVLPKLLFLLKIFAQDSFLNSLLKLVERILVAESIQNGVERVSLVFGGNSILLCVS